MATPIWTGTVSTVYNVNGNWSTNTTPVAADNVWLSRSSTSILSGLDQSATALTSFTQDMSYTSPALVGVPSSGTVAAQYLKINSPNYRLGFPSPASTSGIGPGRLMIDAGTTVSTFTIFDSNRTGNDQSFPPIRLLGSDLTITALGGLFGIAMVPSETATVRSLTMQANSGAISRQCTAFVGPGATMSTVTMFTGALYSSSTITMTSMTLQGNGSYIGNGTNTITTLSVLSSGAAAQLNAATTLTNSSLYGVLDLSQGSGTVTVTNKMLIYKGATIKDPFNRLSWSSTPGYQLVNCGPQDVNLTFGTNLNYKTS